MVQYDWWLWVIGDEVPMWLRLSVFISELAQAWLGGLSFQLGKFVAATVRSSNMLRSTIFRPSICSHATRRPLIPRRSVPSRPGPFSGRSLFGWQVHASKWSAVSLRRTCTWRTSQASTTGLLHHEETRVGYDTEPDHCITSRVPQQCALGVNHLVYVFIGQAWFRNNRAVVRLNSTTPQIRKSDLLEDQSQSDLRFIRIRNGACHKEPYGWAKFHAATCILVLRPRPHQGPILCIRKVRRLPNHWA